MRPLAPSERALWLLGRAAPANGVLVAEARGLDEGALRDGLGRAQRRHPLLRAGVDGDAFVESDAPIPLSIARGDPTAIAEEELNRRFDEAARPLVRATLVDRGDGRCALVICAHHLVCDAQSVIAIALEALAPVDEPLAPAPPVDQLRPPEARGARRWLKLHNQLWRHAWRKVARARKLPLDGLAPLAERRTRLRPHALTVEETDALAARCRAEGTTVHGALAAALLAAAHAQIGPGRAATVGCWSAVDLRARLARPVGGAIGVYVSQATTFHRLRPNGDFWRLARDARNQLAKRIAAGEPWFTFPELGLLVPRGASPVEKFARRVDLASPAAVGVTNLGRLAAPREGRFTVERLQLAVGIAPVTPLALAAATFRGALGWTLLSVEPLVSPARADAIAREVATRLGGRPI